MKTKVTERHGVAFDEVRNERVLYRNDEVVFEDDRGLFVG